MTAAIALVPAFNEAGRIGATVAALARIDSVVEVVVVDDGSVDETGAEARSTGGVCLSLPRNFGKGGALNVGIGLIRQRILEGVASVPTALLLADGDLTDTAERLGALLDALDALDVDMAIAKLPPQEGAAGFGLATGLAAVGLRRFTGRTMDQPLSGQRALRWASVPAVVPFAPRFGVEVAMTLDAARAGLRYVEVDVSLRHKPTGRDVSGTLHRSNQALSIAASLARHAHRRRTSSPPPTRSLGRHPSL